MGLRRRRATLLIAAILATLGVVAAGLTVTGAAGAQHQPHPQITDEMRAALARGESIELIVMTERAPAERASRSAERLAASATQAGLAVEHRFQAIPAATIVVDSLADLERLSADPTVTSLTFNEQATRSLAEARVIIGADRSHAAGLRGEGVTVAVIDSGAERSHSDLSGAITYEACFVRDRQTGLGYCPGSTTERFGTGSAPDDSRSHGTLVAGAIASAGNVAPLGIAPDVDLEIFKVFEEQQGGYLSDVVRALDHIAADRPAVDVINMSLGFSADFTGTCDSVYQPLYEVIETLRDRGVITLAASGNDYSNQMGAPACLTNVVAVAATDDNPANSTFGEVTDFSNVSTTTDVAAPGRQLRTSFIGDRVATVWGTSFAVALVSGCAAIAMQDGMTDPAELATRLATSSVTAANPTGPALPVVDCAFGALIPGNVNCDTTRNIGDALAIGQFLVGIRTAMQTCPLPDPPNNIDVRSADFNEDGSLTILDALFIAQCEVGIDNGHC